MTGRQQYLNLISLTTSEGSGPSPERVAALDKQMVVNIISFPSSYIYKMLWYLPHRIWNCMCLVNFMVSLSYIACCSNSGPKYSFLQRPRPSPGITLVWRGLPHLSQWRCIKVFPIPSKSWQLWKALPAPELPVGLAEVFAATALEWKFLLLFYFPLTQVIILRAL